MGRVVMVKTQKFKVGDTVRVVNEPWAEGIGVYRAVIRKITQHGKQPYIVHFGMLSWKGKNADKCKAEYGTQFELRNLRVC